MTKNNRKEYYKKYELDHKEDRTNKRNLSREELRKKNKTYRDAYKDKIEERRKTLHTQTRMLFLELYGNKCNCCGEFRLEFLTIEHINGKEDKNETGIRGYRKALKEYRPDLYEILCWNCNCSKGRYGYCPHQKENK